jgi:hypothetical protein
MTPTALPTALADLVIEETAETQCILLNLSPGHTSSATQFRQSELQLSLVNEGEMMTRNFGVPMQRARYQPRSFWPLLPIAFIVVGVINAAAHLR